MAKTCSEPAQSAGLFEEHAVASDGPKPVEVREVELDVKPAFDAVVFNTLRVLSAWFAVLLLLFAALDPWVLSDAAEHEPVETQAQPVISWISLSVTEVSAIAVAASLALGGIWAWLRFRPPAIGWANVIAFTIGSIGLVRTISCVLASPNVFRVSILFTLIISAGCVFLSRRWFAAFLSFAITTWYAMAYLRAPLEGWHRSVLLVASAVGVAAVVFTVRRRSILALLRARQIDHRVGTALTDRVRRRDVLSSISTRFVTLSQGGFELAAETTLREIGEALGVDHVFICRVDDAPLRTSVIHEWAAPGQVPRKAQLQNLPLDALPWFCRRFLAGQTTVVSDRDSLPPEAHAEKQMFEAIGTRAMLATPLTRERERPWGYIGLIQDVAPKEWSTDDVNLIQIVGDILLSTLERQRAEQEVRRSEERFRRLFEAELMGMFFADLKGNITQANGAFLNVIGYETHELPLRWDLLTPPEWSKHDEASIVRLLKDGIDRPWEKEFFHKDGRRIPILIGGVLLTYGSGECVAFILDLTERKKSEQKIQQLNAELARTARLGVMGEMAAGLAHEVHQPLAAISNFAAGAKMRLAKGRLSQPELEQVFTEIAEQSHRAGLVIQNIRSFVKDRHPVRRPVDLNAAVQECIGLLRFEIRQREADVRTHLADELPQVLTDVTQLSQILLNLMLNGLQAMENLPAPRVLTIRTSHADHMVLLDVTDTGPGVAVDAIGRLFDQFYTTKVDGLGMGLPIARSIAESHGGRLELASTGAGGTTFMLQLPVLCEEKPRGREKESITTTQ